YGDWSSDVCSSDLSAHACFPFLVDYRSFVTAAGAGAPPPPVCGSALDHRLQKLLRSLDALFRQAIGAGLPLTHGADEVRLGEVIRVVVLIIARLQAADLAQLLARHVQLVEHAL